ncbi:MAG: hypothetical protein FWC84_05730 [Alphaproteobacteria bacterium]|nr:hypothetical protein [Alphaproteobacteria bacterium]
MRNKFFIIFNLIFLFLADAASAQQSLVNDEVLSDATRLEHNIGAELDSLANQPLAQLRKGRAQAESRKDQQAVLKFAAAIVAANPKDFNAWLAYSHAAFDITNDNDLQANATAAAYIAYQRAPGKPEKASALAWLGEIYAKRFLWRPALNSTKASLDLAENAQLRNVYQDMREKHGFRILDYKVDNESASPRICFQFSESLVQGKLDYTPFVTVSGFANAALSVDDQQLCVEGLKHGASYKIVLREGLPSSVDEPLLKSADYEIYVRDRSPLVHFTGRNYVLLRSGQEGIPVISVNTRKVAIDILRIGDRNLLPTVRSEDFLSQLSAYRLKQYKETDAQKIWSGTLQVNPELNAEVTTAFPVLEAVGSLDPTYMFWWPSRPMMAPRPRQMKKAARRRPPNGSSSPTSASPPSPARMAFMPFCAHSPAPGRLPMSKCGSSLATMKS